MSDESVRPDPPLLIDKDQPVRGPDPRVRHGPGLAIGEAATSFPHLVGVDGETYTLGSFEAYDALVLAFLGDACPAVKACVEALVGLQRSLAPRAVRVIGVNSNNPYLSPRDTLAEMTGWAREMGLNFPYLKDLEGKLARGLGVTNTPHFVVLDRKRRVRYRGRMFDSRDPVRATTRDLEDAVACVLDDRHVGVPETNPLGCSIVW